LGTFCVCASFAGISVESSPDASISLSHLNFTASLVPVISTGSPCLATRQSFTAALSEHYTMIRSKHPFLSDFNKNCIFS
jgi:hypothetical protein